MPLNFIVNGLGTITVYVKGMQCIVPKEHVNYDLLKQAAIDGDEDTFEANYTIAKRIETFGEGRVKVKGGVVVFDDEPMHNVVTTRILGMLEDGFNVTPMLRFLENLMENPSMRSVEQLYPFLEKEHLPITEDGCFLAYKYVSIYRGTDRQDKMGKTLTDGDYVDSYTGNSFRNLVGDVNKMPRNQISDDPSSACSRGLHVGALEYAITYGHTHVVVKVNPKNVVCVPFDCSQQKIRCCEYEVFELYTEPLNSTVYREEEEDEYDFEEPRCGECDEFEAECVCDEFDDYDDEFEDDFEDDEEEDWWTT